jgi:hypothetical protein
MEQWSKNDVCAAIWFLNARNMPMPEIHCQLVEVCGEDVKSQHSVVKQHVEHRG